MVQGDTAGDLLLLQLLVFEDKSTVSHDETELLKTSLPLLSLPWQLSRSGTQPLNCIRIFGTPWTVACQAPLPMEFSMQKYWSELSLPTQGIFLTQRSNPHIQCLLHCMWILSHWVTWEAQKLSHRWIISCCLAPSVYSTFAYTTTCSARHKTTTKMRWSGDLWLLFQSQMCNSNKSLSGNR